MTKAQEDYSKKLRDPRWQKIRLKIFERDDWSCTDCGNDKEELHVHHDRYYEGDPWDTPLKFLRTLCNSCHVRYKRYGKLKMIRKCR